MGHNNVVSGHLKSTVIPQVDGLSMRPLDLGCHTNIWTRCNASNGCGSSFSKSIKT